MWLEHHDLTWVWQQAFDNATDRALETTKQDHDAHTKTDVIDLKSVVGGGRDDLYSPCEHEDEVAFDRYQSRIHVNLLLH